jgi:asparagine synthase (glutamine-hydrolysing)
LPTLFDEPFGDSSAIPTYLVAQFARRHVTVSLSGDGGDELFGGYTRYLDTEKAWRTLGRLPPFVRRALARVCGAFAQRNSTSHSGWKAERIAVYLAARTLDECYAAKVVQAPDAHDLVVNDDVPAASIDLMAGLDADLGRAGSIDRMMCADALSYLPDDILVKVDRAAMHVSLETRVPMLDHQFVELAWQLPPHMKVRGRETKWLLKQLARKYVPAGLIDRPKMGFGIPVAQWLRGPLREWCEDLLSETRLRREGFLHARRVHERWRRYAEGNSTQGESIWQVLMFQAWLAARSASEPTRAERAA